MPVILPAGPVVPPALLALNQADAAQLSPLEAGRLAWMVQHAFAAWRIGEADALLIAFDQDAAYDSPNFLWFKDRYRRFVYVDRVVVDPARRGRGLARALYEALFAHARAAGHDRVVCEINAEPPNPGSDAFHAALGFAAIGSGSPRQGNRVRYMERAMHEAGD